MPRRRRSWRSEIVLGETVETTAQTPLSAPSAVTTIPVSSHELRRELIRVALSFGLTLALLAGVVWQARTSSVIDQLAIALYQFLGL